MVVASGRDAQHADALRDRHVVRTTHPRQRPSRRGSEPLRALLRLCPRIRRAAPPVGGRARAPPGFHPAYFFPPPRLGTPLARGCGGGGRDASPFLPRPRGGGGPPPARAWNALFASTATHAIVHDSFYAGD